MATATKTLLTAAEYGRLPDNGPTELVRGRIVALNMPYPRHGEICITIGYLLRRYLEDDDRGRVVSNDSGTVTERDPDTVRGMDVAFYSYQRVPRGPLPRKYLEVSPEAVWEVLSPSDRLPDVMIKVGEYLNAGVIAVCVVDEDAQTVTVHRVGSQPQVFRADDEFMLPDILGEFRVVVRRFFE
jgi:Uma2 family endonuclease